LSTNTLAVSGNGGAVVSGGATVAATNVVVPSTASATGGPAVVNVQAGSTLDIQNTNVPPSAVLAITGTGNVNIAGTSTGGGPINVAGNCVSGKVTQPICPADPTASGNPSTVNVCSPSTLTVPSICGSSATGQVNVAAGATFTVTGSGATIAANLTVSGTATVGAVTASGSLTITAGGTLSIVPDVAVPVVTLQSCAATGLVTIQLPIACATITKNGATGPILTGTINTANFACNVIVTGLGNCPLPPLKVVGSATTGPTRRLLGSTSNCGTATVSSGELAYNYCPETTQAASHAQLSYIVLFASLLISLLVRF